jgi:hypothetical protein
MRDLADHTSRFSGEMPGFCILSREASLVIRNGRKSGINLQIVLRLYGKTNPLREIFVLKESVTESGCHYTMLSARTEANERHVGLI